MSGAGAFAARLGAWRGGEPPLGRALAGAVRDAVVDGRISVGAVLPSERALAGALGVSRGTVVAALALLRAEGWIHTRHGSGSVVRLPPHLTERTTPWSLDHGGAGLDLTRAVTAAPHEPYLRALRRAVERCATLLVDSGEADAGLPALRETIAARYTAGGLPTRPEQILVTSGARGALILLLDQLHDRRRPVVVENPTFPGALDLLRRRRARLATVPVTARGWDADRLAEVTGAGLAYLMPDFHNPTGALMPAAVRARAARLAETVIVDETMRDLDLRTPQRPIPYLPGSRVVSVGSASKLLWGGLRVGWIRAGAALVAELLRNPLQPQLSPPPLEQLVTADLLGDVEAVTAGRRAQLRAQRDHLAALLSGSDAWSFTVPPGGLAIWLRLHHATSADLVTRARARGLALTPGPVFSADRTLTRYLRVPFTATPDLLTRAVGLLRDG
ncbi:PLP-dependent aminotransferase family protein [Spirillospora sp. CA-294931]|uniref:aminotransferase-like domain-containing protein n=1 Tax=Spirillospora sp. CA-294931 TaxID=3240042 RepID=UPI003D908624